MSKPNASTKFKLAGWAVLGSIIAVAVLAAAGIAGSASLRAHRGSAAAKPVAAAQAPALSAEQRGRVQASLGTLPLAFEANQGQTDPRVKYMARGNGYTVFLTANDTVFSLQSLAKESSAKAVATRVSGKQQFGKARPTPAANDVTAAIRMHLIGGNSHPQITAGDQLPGHSNYFIGNDRSQWHSNVAQFARVSYPDVYPGVNLTYYGKQKQLEFDFIVAPGASVAPIRLAVSGAKHISTDDSGNLVLASSAGNVLLHKPFAYQQRDGDRQPVDARFVLQAHNQISLEMGRYDRSRELVIDPSVSYATYLGGSFEDDAYGIAIDTNGDAYVTGQTTSANFPTVAGGFKITNSGVFDAFVTKISSDGSSLLYSTYVGGSGQDSGNAIAVDGSGNAFVAGGTGSADFPHTGGFQTTLKGGFDAFVFELNSAGTALIYSTYIGGTGNDFASGIAIHGGNAVIVGSTSSSDFPTLNPIQSSINGSSNAFVTEVNGSGNALVYSTYLGGGSGDFAAAVAVDSAGNAYVTGATSNSTFPVTSSAFQKTCGSDGTCNGGLPDAFVTVINAAGSGYVYSTFLGGEGIDQGLGIAVDAAGDAYVTGLTQSPVHFPLKAALQPTYGGNQDAFVTELNPSGTALIYSTFLGGTLSDAGAGIAVDANHNAYVTGQTNSMDFPRQSATQGTLGGANDAFVTEINASGSALLFSTYLGGTLNENTNTAGANLSAIGAVAVDSTGANIYVAGNTASTNFPATPLAKQKTNGGGTDAFVAKYAQTGSGSSFTVTNGALSVTSGNPGVSATSTITVTSVGGFNSAVTLACSVTPVVTKGPTCSFTPSNSVTPPANSTATAALNVSTVAASAMLNRPMDRNSRMLYSLFLPLFGITLLAAGVGSAGPRRRKLFGLLMLGLILTGLLVMPACGGSSNNTGGGNTGTPAGSYTITVTGTSGGTTVTGTPALTLTVN